MHCTVFKYLSKHFYFRSSVHYCSVNKQNVLFSLSPCWKLDIQNSYHKPLSQSRTSCLAPGQTPGGQLGHTTKCSSRSCLSWSLGREGNAQCQNPADHRVDSDCVAGSNKCTSDTDTRQSGALEYQKPIKLIQPPSYKTTLLLSNQNQVS